MLLLRQVGWFETLLAGLLDSWFTWKIVALLRVRQREIG
jgi:hypothetical protein